MRSITQPQERAYEPGLDLVRATACLLVVFHHLMSRRLNHAPDQWPARAAGLFAQALRSHAVGGGFGVIYFYVLSAFLLTKLVRAESERTGGVDLRRFWIRRCLRIWPLYFAYLIMLAILARLFAGLQALPATPGPASLVSFTYNWVAWRPGGPPAMTAVLWSVCVEEQFYLLFAGAIRLLGPRRLPSLAKAMIVLGVASRALALAGRTESPALWNMTTSHLDAFGIGMLAGWHWADPPLQLRLPMRTAAVVLSVASPAILAQIFGPGMIGGRPAVLTYTLASLLAVLLILAFRGLDPSGEAGRRALRAAVWFGRRTYGIYIFHWFALLLVARTRHAGRADGYSGSDAALTLLLTLALSTVSYRFLELPFLRLKRRFGSRDSTSRDPEGSGPRPGGRGADDLGDRHAPPLR